MRAARYYGREDLRIEEVAEPTPGFGEVKLQNAYAGICGSDLHAYFAPENLAIDLSQPHPLTGATPPLILGHEFSGTVVAIGNGVTNVSEGDRVAVWPVYYCGRCAACRKKKYNLCPDIGFHGITSKGGGTAAFTTIAANKVHKLPGSVDLRLGALVEPMAVGWHAVRRSGAQAGQSALVVGGGPIGIGIWFALRAQGIDRVIVAEPNIHRRRVLQRLGAATFDPVATNQGAAVAEFTNGDGIDVAFDAAGAAVATIQAMAGLTPGGRLVVVAFHERPIDFSPNSMIMVETEVVGANAHLPEDFNEVIAAMAAGAYDTTGWVDETDLDGLVEAMHTLRSGRGTKMLVRSGT
jgi:(R,R)-butanediol dehydrogenase / meso-butanediol dehydrogenase / diacetyl reductase